MKHFYIPLGGVGVAVGELSKSQPARISAKNGGASFSIARPRFKIRTAATEAEKISWWPETKWSTNVDGVLSQTTDSILLVIIFNLTYCLTLTICKCMYI